MSSENSSWLMKKKYVRTIEIYLRSCCGTDYKMTPAKLMDSLFRCRGLRITVTWGGKSANLTFSGTAMDIRIPFLRVWCE